MRVRADLDAVLDRVREVRDVRRRLGVDLAALKAEPAVDAVRPVAERSVGDRDRADTYADPGRQHAAPRLLGGAAEGMRRVRVGVRIAPGPVLPRDGELALHALVVRLELCVADRPVRADPIARE